MRSLLFALVLLVSCSPEVKQYYKLVPCSKREMLRNTHGAYILAFSSEGTVEGEYIGRYTQGICVLTLHEVQQIPFDSLSGFRLTVTRNRSSEYLLLTGLLVTPSVLGAIVHPSWARGFLFVAIMVGSEGGFASMVESTRDSHVINYPGDERDITQLDKYARFPAGIPDHIDLMGWVRESPKTGSYGRQAKQRDG